MIGHPVPVTAVRSSLFRREHIQIIAVYRRIQPVPVVTELFNTGEGYTAHAKPGQGKFDVEGSGPAILQEQEFRLSGHQGDAQLSPAVPQHRVPEATLFLSNLGGIALVEQNSVMVTDGLGNRDLLEFLGIQSPVEQIAVIGFRMTDGNFRHMGVVGVLILDGHQGVYQSVVGTHKLNGTPILSGGVFRGHTVVGVEQILHHVQIFAHGFKNGLIAQILADVIAE